MVDGEVREVSLVNTSSSSTSTAQARNRPAGRASTSRAAGVVCSDDVRRGCGSATGSGVARRAPLGGGGLGRRAPRGGGGTSTDEPAQVAAWREPGRGGGVGRAVKAGQLAGRGFTTSWCALQGAVHSGSLPPWPPPRPSMRLPAHRCCGAIAWSPVVGPPPAAPPRSAANPRVGRRGPRVEGGFSLSNMAGSPTSLFARRDCRFTNRGDMYVTTGTTTAGGPHPIVAAMTGFGGGWGLVQCNCHSFPRSRQRNRRPLCLPGADSEFKSRSGGGGPLDKIPSLPDLELKILEQISFGQGAASRSRGMEPAEDPPSLSSSRGGATSPPNLVRHAMRRPPAERAWAVGACSARVGSGQSVALFPAPRASESTLGSGPTATTDARTALHRY